MVAAEGSWTIAYVAFVAFVSLEIPLWLAVCLTIFLTSGHFVCSVLFANEFRYLIESELIGNTVTWGIVACAGFWIHRKTEGATRRAFLDTRQSIQARLAAHDENDKLGKQICLHSTRCSVRNSIKDYLNLQYNVYYAFFDLQSDCYFLFCQHTWLTK